MDTAGTNYKFHSKIFYLRLIFSYKILHFLFDPAEIGRCLNE